MRGTVRQGSTDNTSVPSLKSILTVFFISFPISVTYRLFKGRIESETWTGMKKSYATLDDLFEQTESFRKFSVLPVFSEGADLMNNDKLVKFLVTACY